MKNSFEEWAVILAGTVTSILTAVLVIAIEELTGFSVFTWMLWFVLPVGALLVGGAAASGYYFGAVHFNQRPTGTLALNIISVAVGTQFLIYYLGYIRLADANGTYISDVITFGQYLTIILTKAKYGLVGSRSSGGLEVGSWGYLIGFLQFLGVAVGGVAVFAFLSEKPYCGKCEKFFVMIGSECKCLDKPESAEEFLLAVRGTEAFSNDYLALVGKERTIEKFDQGAAKFEFLLFRCPKCLREEVHESVEVYNGEEWKKVPKLERKLSVADGHSISRWFPSARNKKDVA